MHRSTPFIRLATAVAVAFSVALASLTFYRMLTSPIDPGRAVYAVPALICYLPLQTWLVWSAARGETGRRQLVVLAALATVGAGILPVVGAGWLATFDVPAALLLVYLRPPLSFLLFAVLAAALAPLTIAFGHRELALYSTLGLLVNALPLAVGLWLLRVVRQLQAARLELAEEAVAGERLRIDRELRHALGVALEAITHGGEAAAGLLAADPASAERELRALAVVSRRTLTEARRMVTRYRETSLRAELEAAVTLLAAAGIEAELLPPVTGLPDSVDEDQRDALRRDVAALLSR